MEVLLAFRVGRMRLENGRLSADTRRGMLRLDRDEAGLLHLAWFERHADGSLATEPELDLITALPGEAVFEKINQPGARVFTLKFPDDKSREQLFFWAQEPSTDHDEDYVAAVNALLVGLDGGPDDMDAEQQLGGLAAQVATPALAAPTSAASAGAIDASLLAAALGSVMADGAALGASQSARQRLLRAQLAQQPSLLEVLRPELVGPLLDGSPALVERVAAHLPEAYRSPAAVQELISTPQFRHQVGLLSHALRSGELDTTQFGLPPGGLGVLDFLKAVQKEADDKVQAQQQASEHQQDQHQGS